MTSQSQKIREFYKYMAKEFPFLAFTFRGRIKSLIRTEEKFNGYIVEYIYNYYEEHGTYPAVADLKEKLSCFRDIIAYRIVIALPKCHLKPGQNLEEKEMKYLYQIANALPGFLEERGFTAEPAKGVRESKSDLLNGEVKPYYRDFISNPTMYGYRSLHISVYDNTSRSYMEVQLRTKKMDDIAEIGPANHLGYEKRQEHERARRDNSVKMTYDLAQMPEYEDLMTSTSNLTGEKINRFTNIHMNAQDLVKKVKMQRLCGQKTAACFQRCVGMDAFNAVYSTSYEIDEKYGTHYFENFKKFLQYTQEKDLTVDGAMTDPKGDRSLAPHAQKDPDLFLHVVERRPDGIVVRGAKAHQTGFVNSHEVIVMPT